MGQQILMAGSGIPCAYMRGGTSKGAVFLASDLPADATERDLLLLRIMGSPDLRQVDGLGGAHPLTSKVAVVSPSTEPDVDVDYLFLQVVVDRPVVSASQTCGNMLAAVGPFAVERGLVAACADTTEVRVRLVNTDTIAVLKVHTPAGEVTYDGDTVITGVPGAAAAVEIVAESSSRPMLPTGRVQDQLAGVAATCVDNGMPSVIVRAADLGCTGAETPEQLEADEPLLARVREVRAAAAELMGIHGDLAEITTPKVVLVSPPTASGAISTRSFIPDRVHQAIGVRGAASVGAAIRLPGSVARWVANVPPDDAPLRIEHPTGFLDVSVATDPSQEDPITTTSVLRTARMIMDGRVHPAPGPRVEEIA